MAVSAYFVKGASFRQQRRDSIDARIQRCEQAQETGYLPELGISVHGIHRAANPLVLPDVVSSNLLIPCSLPTCTLCPHHSYTRRSTPVFEASSSDDEGLCKLEAQPGLLLKECIAHFAIAKEQGPLQIIHQEKTISA